ncbi:isopeptide-forming domain-containing fimbrial protein [Demequina litorisediminis]|uniref:DUF11 domain-containing protein n=1 Tax=Demequina litorisediminis TaxID=1849022 RepID=A0ABQ6IEB2_9MICO|nr:isopeptide-forming domain-containing fimbrial protein [Demequina litorisediminis]GMA35507.1 hypothetical protein GCM10025876_17110 [Demequina litorisediminis]
MRSVFRWQPGKALTAVLVALLASTGIVALGTTASAAVQPATLSIEKSGPSGDDLPLVPGEPFNYVITIQCSYLVPNSGCYNASVTDTIPAPLEPAGNPAVVSDGNTATVSTDGNSFSVDFVTTFLDPTDPGSGMLGGTTATITVPVVVPEDVNYDYNADDIVNTAEFSADNPDTATVSDDHTVQIDVPLELDTEVSKTFDPDEAVAADGEPTLVTIDASNQSGTGVESLAVSEPAPGSGSTTFAYLALDSLTITSVPAGADQVVISVDTGGGLEEISVADLADVSLPYVVDLSGVDLDEVVGLQVSFLDDDGALIEDGEGAQIQVGLTQRDPGEAHRRRGGR